MHGCLVVTGRVQYQIVSSDQGTLKTASVMVECSVHIGGMNSKYGFFDWEVWVLQAVRVPPPPLVFISFFSSSLLLSFFHFCLSFFTQNLQWTNEVPRKYIKWKKKICRSLLIVLSRTQMKSSASDFSCMSFPAYASLVEFVWSDWRQTGNNVGKNCRFKKKSLHLITSTELYDSYPREHRSACWMRVPLWSANGI